MNPKTATAVRKQSRSRSSSRRLCPALLVALGAAAWATGCGGGDDVPKPVAVATVCAADDGDRVELRGFLRLPERISLTDRAAIDIFSRRGGAGVRASVEFTLGTGPDQLERPEAGFTPTSLRVRGSDGTVATLNDQVVVAADVVRKGADCVLRNPAVAVVPN